MAIKNTQGLVIAQALRFDCETHETTMTMVGDGGELLAASRFVSVPSTMAPNATFVVRLRGPAEESLQSSVGTQRHDCGPS